MEGNQTVYYAPDIGPYIFTDVMTNAQMDWNRLTNESQIIGW